MEKIINIDGKEVKLKTNGAFLYKYKDQFRRDGLQDITKLSQIKIGGEVDLSNLDIEIFYNFFWVMAKAGNPEIPPLAEYLEMFDVFPILDILPDVLEMTMCNLQTSKKK
jgi:hypothetical protein